MPRCWPSCEQLGVDALPTAPAVVAGYVAELADPPDDRRPARVSTITRRLAAIGEGHKVAGHPNPCTDALVRETMKGVRRALGAPNQKKGVTTGDIKAAVATLRPGLAGHRDRLLLTLGFAGGFRRHPHPPPRRHLPPGGKSPPPGHRRWSHHLVVPEASAVRGADRPTTSPR